MKKDPTKKMLWYVSLALLFSGVITIYHATKFYQLVASTLLTIFGFAGLSYCITQLEKKIEDIQEKVGGSE